VYVGKSGEVPVTSTSGSGAPTNPTPVSTLVRKQKVLR
jgi:hypothetical protein